MCEISAFSFSSLEGVCGKTVLIYCSFWPKSWTIFTAYGALVEFVEELLFLACSC